FVQQAVEYEARRQIDILESGGVIDQETRLFDPGRGETRSMRSKEEAHDYRYFPDPDLLPLRLTQEFVEELRRTLPELPDEKRDRFVRDLGIPVYNASVLTAEKENADYFERFLDAIVQETGKPLRAIATQASNWMIGDLFGALNKAGKDITESPVSVTAAARLQKLLIEGVISGRIAKEVFEIMFETGEDPETIVEQKGLRQVSDTGAIEAAINQVLAEQADKVAEYRSGKDKLFGFFVGQVMKKTQGKANPQLVNDLLKTKLNG
ncbi:MAG TPA: Asp-tRNA(Asn)/Glu-tRNA(Gln) amidotransferase GatCAB subunit B, partial [Sphingomonadales bacterium]